MIRLVHLLRRDRRLCHREFADYWLDRHGPLVSSHQHRLGILRYVQTHPDPDSIQPDAAARAFRGGMEEPFDGVAETWWKSEACARAAIANEKGKNALRELLADLAHFVDGEASPLWFAQEFPQVGTSPERPLARPRSGVVKVHYALRPPAGMNEADAKHYWHAVHGSLVRSFAVARGAVGYCQAHRIETDLTALFGSPTGTAAIPYMGHAEIWTDRSVARAGPDIAETMQRTTADEWNFIGHSRSHLFTGKEYLLVDRNW